MVYLMVFKQETHLKIRLWERFEKDSAGWREAQNVGSTSPWLESQTKENGEVRGTPASISLCFWTVDPMQQTASGSGCHDFLSRGTVSSNCAKIDPPLTCFWFRHNHKGNWHNLWRQRLAIETQSGRYHWGRVSLVKPPLLSPEKQFLSCWWKVQSPPKEDFLSRNPGQDKSISPVILSTSSPFQRFERNNLFFMVYG